MSIHRKPLRRENDPAPCRDPVCEGGLCTLCNGWGYKSTWQIVTGDDDPLAQWKYGGYSVGRCPHGCATPRMFLSTGPVYDHA